MGSRHNKIERLGVIETDLVVTKQLGWIFREQPIVDVGIDAIIEQSEDGIPKGRFIAIQIKAGKANFYESDNHLTLYVSHIHYNYWLNLEIPIILVAHLPETEQTYWQYVCEKNFKKTKKKWKIDIPKNQKFNAKAKKELVKILSSKANKSIVFDLYSGVLEPESLFDFAEKTECIGDSVDSINNITKIILELDHKTKMFKSKLAKYLKERLSDRDPQVKASIKGFGKDLNIGSKRIETEVVLFSELFSEGFLAFEQVVLLHYMFTKDEFQLSISYESLLIIPSSVDEALNGMIVMRNGIFNLPQKYLVLKKARRFFLEVIDFLIYELEEARDLAIKLIDKIELVKQQNDSK